MMKSAGLLIVVRSVVVVVDGQMLKRTVFQERELEVLNFEISFAQPIR